MTASTDAVASSPAGALWRERGRCRLTPIRRCEAGRTEGGDGRAGGGFLRRNVYGRGARAGAGGGARGLGAVGPAPRRRLRHVCASAAGAPLQRQRPWARGRGEPRSGRAELPDGVGRDRDPRSRRGALAGDAPRPVGGAAPLVVACVLDAAIFWPGIVTQSDLDARWINALPALGVALSVGLTLAAVGATGRGRLGPLTRGDRVRLAFALVMLFFALPWIGSDLGIPLRRWPLVGSLFLSDQLKTEPGNPVPFPAVHLGVHHGLDGTLLVITALALSRQLGRIGWPRLRTALALYLSLMLVYGFANAAEDFEDEQIVKRGWTTHGLPSVLQPGPTLAWAALLLVAAIVYVALFRVRSGFTAAALAGGDEGRHSRVR